MKHLVAVYGTLKQGFHNHHRLKDSKRIGNTIVKGDLYDLGSYPALIDGSDDIIAEVYEVNQKVLDDLDYLEQNGRWYNREVATVNVDGEWMNVWVYKLLERCYRFLGNAKRIAPDNLGIVCYERFNKYTGGTYVKPV